MRHVTRDQRGQALVEFALLIPVVLLLIFGVIDLGRVVFINNSLSDGARHGARNASVDPRAVDYCSVIDEAVRSATRGQPLSTYTVTYQRIAPDGTPEGAALIVCQNGSDGPGKALLPSTVAPGDRVTVVVEANVDLILGFIARAAGADTFNLHADSTMQVTFAP